MYNTELKEKFVKEYTDGISLRKSCLTLFNFLEKYENEWGADICTKREDELKQVVDNVVGLRVSSKTLRLSILRNYAEWCIKNNVPGACDGLLKINPDNTEKIKQEMVRNPRHLQRYLDEICVPESDETADNTIRCYYWLAYAGMAEADIFNVRCSDVHLDDLVVVYNGEAYTIYREAIQAFKNCVNLKEFVYVHPNYEPIKRSRVDGDILIRGFRSVPTVGSMRVELSRRSKRYLAECSKSNDKCGLRLSYYRVWLSGVFYRLYEDELAGIKPDFYVIVDAVTGDKEYNLSSGRNTQGAKKRKLASEYSTDYKRWKMTFA